MSGLATALELLGASGVVADDDVNQAELFEADAAMPAMLPPAAPPRSGPQGGRPKGARNKSTEAFRDLYLSKFRHPLMAIGELTSRTPIELARELKLYLFHEGKLVTAPVLDAEGRVKLDENGHELRQPVLAVGEAFKAQREMLVAALPYLAQKLPMAVEVTTPTRGVVVLGDLNVQSNGQLSALDLPLAPEQPSEQNQQVIDGDSVRLPDVQSHDNVKPMKPMGKFVDDV